MRAQLCYLCCVEYGLYYSMPACLSCNSDTTCLCCQSKGACGIDTSTPALIKVEDTCGCLDFSDGIAICVRAFSVSFDFCFWPSDLLLTDHYQLTEQDCGLRGNVLFCCKCGERCSAGLKTCALCKSHGQCCCLAGGCAVPCDSDIPFGIGCLGVQCVGGRKKGRPVETAAAHDMTR